MSKIKIKQISGLTDTISKYVPNRIKYKQESILTLGWDHPEILGIRSESPTPMVCRVPLLLERVPVGDIQVFLNGILVSEEDYIFSNDFALTEKTNSNLEYGDELFFISYQSNVGDDGDLITVIYDVDELVESNKCFTTGFSRSNLTERRTGYSISIDFIGNDYPGHYILPILGGVRSNAVSTFSGSEDLTSSVIRASSTVNSGYNISLSQIWSSFVFMDGLQMDCVFKLPTDTLDNVIRIGFTYGSNSVTEPTFGNYFVINGNLLVGKTNNNSVVTQTSSFTLTSNIWYQTRVKESVDVDGTSRVTFTVYDIDGLELYNQSSTTNISFTNTRTTQVLGIHTITGLSKTIATFDYLGTTLPQMVRGSLN